MTLNYRRILTPEAMRFELHTREVPEGDLPEDFDPASEKNLDRIREELITEVSDLLEAGGGITNKSRLFRDLYQREKRAGTAVGHGVALPHVRTMQATRFVMAFGRSRAGLPFRAPDGEPVHLFFAMVAPAYEDRLYLKVYRSLGSALLQPELVRDLMNASEPEDVWRVIEIFR